MKAFPSVTPLYSPERGSMIGRQEHSGMELRDWFAGRAMQGMLSENSGIRYSTDELVEFAYRVADAMMEARDAKKDL